MFSYTLAVLTHGTSYTLHQCLESFHEQVKPEPSVRIVLHDGPGFETPPSMERGSPWMVIKGGPQRGFCVATKQLWLETTRQRPEYVFWLEHDFRFERKVDLSKLALVLDSHPKLAQVALMRDAVNTTEKAAGGLFESRPGEYERRWAGHVWHEHHSYFTTNPSLMRREFMTINPWPDYPVSCEGRFGIDLIARGYSYGVWGDGSPWVKHIGKRDGSGYGY